MTQITVVDAVLVEVPTGEREWSCIVEVDGATVAYTFPEDTVAIRCAEYGFDPDTDADEVLGIILAEPFAPNPPGLDRDPRHLHNNPDRDDARAHLRERVAGQGARVAGRARRAGKPRPPRAAGARLLLDVDDEPGDALDVLRANLPRRSERAERVSARLDSMRAELRARRPRR